MAIQPILLRINDAAAAIGVSRVKLYSLINNGRITALKEGKRTLISAAELEAYAEMLTREAEERKT